MPRPSPESMSVVRLNVFAIAAVITLACAPQASAWGPDGHRIVCRIAYQLLDAPRRADINRLTAVYRTPPTPTAPPRAIPSFFEGCAFLDEARSHARDHMPGWERFAVFDAWHFLNVARTTHLIADSECHGNCVLTGIAHHADALAHGADDAARAEALFFLGHWAGDIHQPLHISYADDLGGNNIKPIAGGFYASGHLHAVWDSGIITKAMDAAGWRAYADRLAQDITPAEKAAWVGGQPIAWAQESYNLTTKPKVQYCKWKTANGASTCTPIAGGRTLAQPYQNTVDGVVETRLQTAGVRLADLIRQHLVMPPPSP